MLRYITIIISLLLMPVALDAQCCRVRSEAVEVQRLHLNSTEGSNGTAVVYNPAAELYYTFFAGNEAFPVEVFDSEGHYLYRAPAGFDTRGVWWDANRGQVVSNGFYQFGISSLEISADGLPTGSARRLRQANQPDAQACGAYDPYTDCILYRDSSYADVYDFETNTLVRRLPLQDIPAPLAHLNRTTLLMTDCPQAEIAVADYVSGQLYFFDRLTGTYSGTCRLPEDAPVSEAFRLSFANGLVWLFDAETREWIGYDVFEYCM